MQPLFGQLGGSEAGLWYHSAYNVRGDRFKYQQDYTPSAVAEADFMNSGDNFRWR